MLRAAPKLSMQTATLTFMKTVSPSWQAAIAPEPQLRGQGEPEHQDIVKDGSRTPRPIEAMTSREDMEPAERKRQNAALNRHMKNPKSLSPGLLETWEDS